MLEKRRQSKIGGEGCLAVLHLPLFLPGLSQGSCCKFCPNFWLLLRLALLLRAHAASFAPIFGWFSQLARRFGCQRRFCSAAFRVAGL